MKHIVKLVISLIDSRGNMMGAYRSPLTDPKVPEVIGNAFILEPTPAFAGAVASFTAEGDGAYHFDTFWDAFEAVNTLLKGPINHRSIDRLMRTAVDMEEHKGRTLGVQAYLYPADNYYDSSVETRQQPAVVTTAVLNVGTGQYFPAPSMNPTALQFGAYEKFEDKETYTKVLNEFFNLLFRSAVPEEPMYLQFAPITGVGTVGVMGATPVAVFNQQPNMMAGNGYMHNGPTPGFMDEVYEDLVTRNTTLFISVRIEGGNGNLTWFDLRTHSNSSIAFHDATVVGLSPFMAPLALIAARIVAYQIRSGEKRLTSIHDKLETGGSFDCGLL